MSEENQPYWKKIISPFGTLIVLVAYGVLDQVVAFIVNKITETNTLSYTWKFLNWLWDVSWTPVSIPLCGFVLGAILSVIAVIMIYLKYWPKSRRVDWNDTRSITKNFRRMEWKDVSWEWGYSYLSVNYPSPICPKCHAEMRQQDTSRYDTHIQLLCPNDGYKVFFRNEFEDFDDLRRSARDEVLRQIRAKMAVMEFR